MSNHLQSPFYHKNASCDWKQKCLDLLLKIEDKSSDTVCEGNTYEIQKNKQEAELKLLKIENEIDDLTKRIKEIEEISAEKTSIRPELALYELITKLRWDLESPENELKGFVAGRPLKVFNLDATKHSEQEIVDYLWKLIDPKSL